MAGLAYGAMLLPLLQHAGALVDMAGYLVECVGKSGLGKSTVQRLIVSLAANPDNSEIIGSFDRTAVSTGTTSLPPPTACHSAWRSRLIITHKCFGMPEM